MIAEGIALVRERLAAVARGEATPGRFQILAAINAVHVSVSDARDTDWSQVVALYDQLAAIDPNPIVQLNRAIAIAELDGPDVALALVDELDDPLNGYHAYHAPEPTCCADSPAQQTRGQPTTEPSTSPPTPPNSSTLPDAAINSRRDVAAHPLVFPADAIAHASLTHPPATTRMSQPSRRLDPRMGPGVTRAPAPSGDSSRAAGR